MTEKLVKAWATINGVGMSPWTALISLLFFGGWIGLALLTGHQSLIVCDGHGPRWFGYCQFDPGAQFASAIQNLIQLVLLFVAASLAGTAGALAMSVATDAKAAREHSEATHAHVRNIRQTLKAAPPKATK